MFGISLQFEPKIVQVSLIEPVQAVVIDQAAIEREKIHKADLQRQREEEVRRQAEKKKAERLEVKRQADLKKRQEVERKRKQEEKKKKETEAKHKAEAKQQEEKKKKETEAKRKAEAKQQEEIKRQAEEKKQRDTEAKRQAEEKKKRDAEAKRQAEEKKKRDAEAKRQAEEKKQREAEEAERQLISFCKSAFLALVGEIKNKVHNNWTYAGDATGLEVTISVKVTRDGEVASGNVGLSSGDAIFDRSAVNALRKASPLPFPDDPRCYEKNKEFNFKFTP